MGSGKEFSEGCINMRLEITSSTDKTLSQKEN